MYRFLRQSTSKLFITILLISSILLLCPNPTASPQSSETTPASAFAMSASSHASGADSGASRSHSGLDDHGAVSPATVVSYLVLLFAILIFVTIFVTLQLLIAAKWAYSTKLKFYRQRYRILIKPKLETLFKRWLNLLGGTIAYNL